MFQRSLIGLNRLNDGNVLVIPDRHRFMTMNVGFWQSCPTNKAKQRIKNKRKDDMNPHTAWRDMDIRVSSRCQDHKLLTRFTNSSA
jgi:hypothetical protein